MWGQTLLGFAFSPPRARCVDGLASEPCAALGHQQPGQVVLPRSKVALDGSALVASNRVLDAQAALEASDPQPRPLEIELVAPHLDGLADPQTVPVDHEQKGVVANAVAPLFAASSRRSISGPLKEAQDGQIDLRISPGPSYLVRVNRHLLRFGRAQMHGEKLIRHCRSH